MVFEKKEKQEDRPEIKDLAKEYLTELSSLSNAQLINKIYRNTYNKKPDIEMNVTQLLNRILYKQKFGKYIEDTKKSFNNKKKKFNGVLNLRVFLRNQKRREIKF